MVHTLFLFIHVCACVVCGVRICESSYRAHQNERKIDNNNRREKNKLKKKAGENCKAKKWTETKNKSIQFKRRRENKNMKEKKYEEEKCNNNYRWPIDRSK